MRQPDRNSFMLVFNDLIAFCFDLICFIVDDKRIDCVFVDVKRIDCVFVDDKFFDFVFKGKF